MTRRCCRCWWLPSRWRQRLPCASAGSKTTTGIDCCSRCRLSMRSRGPCPCAAIVMTRTCRGSCRSGGCCCRLRCRTRWQTTMAKACVSARVPKRCCCPYLGEEAGPRATWMTRRLLKSCRWRSIFATTTRTARPSLVPRLRGVPGTSRTCPRPYPLRSWGARRRHGARSVCRSGMRRRRLLQLLSRRWCCLVMAALLLMMTSWRRRQLVMVSDARDLRCWMLVVWDPTSWAARSRTRMLRRRAVCVRKSLRRTGVWVTRIWKTAG